jgi:hypothetical protein
MELRDAIAEYSEQPITKQILFGLLRDYKRPYDKISEMIKTGMLITVKAGIYVAGPNLPIAKPEPFLVANHLWGPSYVSMDSALAHWGMIPEKVFEISSVTTKISKDYSTLIGRFSYTHLPLPYYSFGIQQLEMTKKQRVLIATPEKALCDKVIGTSGLLLRSTKMVTDLLFDDLRMDSDQLKKLNREMMSEWIRDAPKKNSLRLLINVLNQL